MKNNCKTIYDIFPGIDFSKDTGLLLLEDGSAVGIDYKKHLAFLGTEENNLFFINSVTAISSDVVEERTETAGDQVGFDFYSTLFKNCVITTNVSTMEPIINCEGFEHFYVVDADTNEVVFHTTDFSEFEGEFFSNDEFDEFCEKINDGESPW